MSKGIVGLVDIETSHPGSWIPIIRELGYEVTVFDSGRRYSSAQIESFAQEHGVLKVYTNLEEMAAEVDLGIIATANWDLHLQQCRPFIAQGRPVLIDKPLVGSYDHLEQLLKWHEEGAIIGGGSSLRYSSEISALKAELEEKEAEVLSVYAVCSGMGYYYAVHLVSMLQALLGSGIARVRELGTCPWRVELFWNAGQSAVVEVVCPDKGYVPFEAAVVTNKGMHRVVIDDIPRLYRDFLSTVIPALLDKALPVPLEELVEVERALLGVLLSHEEAGRWVKLKELTAASPVYDGTEFFENYLRSVR